MVDDNKILLDLLNEIFTIDAKNESKIEAFYHELLKNQMRAGYRNRQLLNLVNILKTLKGEDESTLAAFYQELLQSPDEAEKTQ